MKAHGPLPIRILTHNIRYATSSPFKGEKPWPERRDVLINELRYHTLHNPESFICLQEVLHEQLVDILAGLNGSCPTTPPGPPEEEEEDDDDDEEHRPNPQKQEWSYIGVGRDDGLQAGEYSPILFRGAVWRLDHWRTVWLSPTPGQPGKGWDAGSVRIVTVGAFVHRGSKGRVVGMSTHFDEQGVVSRRESARIVRRIAGDGVSTSSTTTISTSTSPSSSSSTAEEPLHTTAHTHHPPPPVWLAGDLNSQPTEEAYHILNAPDSPLQDSRSLATWRYGNQITCTGFQEEMRQVIDYVFVGRKGWRVEGYSVLPNRFDDGVYCSDHRAVVVDALLEG